MIRKKPDRKPWLVTLALVAAVTFLVYPACAGGKVPADKFIASTIPDSLKKDVHAVIRYDDLSFEVKSVRSAEERRHRVVTVLDEEGRGFGELAISYDGFIHLDDLTMRVLDASGDEIRSLEKKDVNDYAATGDFNLHDDSRVRVAKMYHSTYPYTVEYEIVYDHHGYIGWPEWSPEETRASVEYSRFSVAVPKATPLRYWRNTGREPAVTEDGDTRQYTWIATGLPSFEREALGPALVDQEEFVRTAPTVFEIADHPGTMDSWSSFGAWCAGLYSGRQSLPDQEQKEIAGLLAGSTSPVDKARLLYGRLQSRTRYVSVQLGIGGWQPLDAAFVCQHSYGDCKALCNYMVAMLGAAGVTAYPALVSHSSPPPVFTPEFVHNCFNHVMTCVPLADDTLWLECTSQTIPFGHITRNTENRFALLVTPAGGVLVRTPQSKAADNMQIRKATVQMSGNGDAVADVVTVSTGDQQDLVRDGLFLATAKEREDWVREHIDVRVFNLQGTDFSGIQPAGIRVGYGVTLGLPRMATTAGSRLLFQPNLMDRRTYVPPVIENRKHPVVHAYPYVDIDSITYRLPNGWVVEAVPAPVTLESPFATFFSAVEQPGPGFLLYSRRLEVSQTEVPAGRYKEYRKFFQDVAQADKASAAIVRK